jgi:hypothetical protein
MKAIVSYEQITCDMCGQAMTREPSRLYVEGIYLGDKYVHASVDISAIHIGSEYRCLCNECRKKILEEAIHNFT